MIFYSWMIAWIAGASDSVITDSDDSINHNRWYSCPLDVIVSIAYITKY